MSNESPRRLKRPFPKAKSARSPFESEPNFPSGDPEDTKVTFVPIVQWGSIRIRGQITGAAGAIGLAFVRPARQKDPGSLPDALVYGVDQPAVDGTAWVDGAEFSLEITAAEHQGENWLKITLNPAGAADIDFFDISGVNLGQGS